MILAFQHWEYGVWEALHSFLSTRRGDSRFFSSFVVTIRTYRIASGSSGKPQWFGFGIANWMDGCDLKIPNFMN